MVTKPVLYTPMVDTEVSLGRPCQEELIRKIVQNMNMLAELAPVGAVEAYNTNQSGVAVPNSTVFQLSNGSAIAESTSPLYPGVTPNTIYRFIRGANASTTISNELTPATLPTSGPDTGVVTIRLAHHHSSLISHAAQDPRYVPEGDENFAQFPVHWHDTDQELSAFEHLQPAYFAVTFYLKIN